METTACEMLVVAQMLLSWLFDYNKTKYNKPIFKKKTYLLY